MSHHAKPLCLQVANKSALIVDLISPLEYYSGNIVQGIDVSS